MQPLLCPGGYGVPVKAGRYKVCQIHGIIDAGQSADVHIVDDGTLEWSDSMGNLLTSKTSNQKTLFRCKGYSSTDGHLSVTFSEPVDVKNGLSLIEYTGIEPGTLLVYVR